MVSAARVVTPTGVVDDGAVVVDGSRFHAVLAADERAQAVAAGASAATHLAFPDATLLPGFIDLHVHGAGGWRVGASGNLVEPRDQNMDPIVEMARLMARTGVTGFLPTLSTSTQAEMLGTVRQAARWVGRDLPGADVLGTHLEGPYLNRARSGAQRSDLMQLPSSEAFQPIWEASNSTVRYVTLAPELPGATSFIAWLAEHGVHVSAGHSDARAQQMPTAARAGLRGVTHLFNAMSGVHHREPGLAAWALADDQAYVELIGDGLHVHPTVMRLAIRAKGVGRVAIVTDGGAFTGLPDGVYREGQRTVAVSGGISTLEDGTLAESASPMNRNCMVLLRDVGVSWTEIAHMTALVPATMLGLQARRGSIEAGKDADLAVLGPDGDVLLTTVRGRVVHRA